jgi:hypothetical protein
MYRHPTFGLHSAARENTGSIKGEIINTDNGQVKRNLSRGVLPATGFLLPSLSLMIGEADNNASWDTDMQVGSRARWVGVIRG